MHNAIITKYHGPGNVYGSRVSAQSNGKKIVLDWDHSIDAKENHIRAARELCRRNMWIGLLHSAPADKFFCHVFDDSEGTFLASCEVRSKFNGITPSNALSAIDEAIKDHSKQSLFIKTLELELITHPNFSLRND